MRRTTTIRFDNETLRQLDDLAEAQQSSRSHVVREAVDRYLDYHTWFVSQIQEGLKAIERGDVISHAEGKDRIRALGFHVE